ncbi:hypothetical protein I7I51_02686 [Histoplasma capsulatum]|uniref:Uncharacterized protein n=1 Tax=Ajellomyces capsulatus TaxID=5037 RepID=A0A8A1ME06_AJECA|nr:hypothetical protein I7I51_02686 [Histoplasma capsulatum]
MAPAASIKPNVWFSLVLTITTSPLPQPLGPGRKVAKLNQTTLTTSVIQLQLLCHEFNSPGLAGETNIWFSLDHQTGRRGGGFGTGALRWNRGTLGHGLDKERKEEFALLHAQFWHGATCNKGLVNPGSLMRSYGLCHEFFAWEQSGMSQADPPSNNQRQTAAISPPSQHSTSNAYMFGQTSNPPISHHWAYMPVNRAGMAGRPSYASPGATIPANLQASASESAAYSYQSQGQTFQYMPDDYHNTQFNPRGSTNNWGLNGPTLPHPIDTVPTENQANMLGTFTSLRGPPRVTTASRR